MLGFNSTTVQLIHWINTEWLDGEEFQFHNGTINTISVHIFFFDSVMFQFHNGTINTGNKKGNMDKNNQSFNSTTVQLIPKRQNLEESEEIRFNSTTVQLIQNVMNVESKKQEQFQFHNGTINTPTAKRANTSDNRFNSTTVQLIL